MVLIHNKDEFKHWKIHYKEHNITKFFQFISKPNYLVLSIFIKDFVAEPILTIDNNLKSISGVIGRIVAYNSS